VNVLAGKRLLRDPPLVGDLRNSLQERSEELQGIVLDIVGKFDESSFLESVEQGFHRRVGLNLIDAELSGKPCVHCVSERHVAEDHGGDKSPIDRRQRHHA
jgi:hypothetical protein